VVIKFLEQHIMTKFGVLKTTVFDNDTYFSSLKLTAFSLEKGIILKYEVNYYPEWNGLVEYRNKKPIHIYKRIVVK